MARRPILEIDDPSRALTANALFALKCCRCHLTRRKWRVWSGWIMKRRSLPFTSAGCRLILRSREASRTGSREIIGQTSSGLTIRRDFTVYISAGACGRFRSTSCPGGYDGRSQVDASSPEVAARVACGDSLVAAEHGSMSSLACEVFDGVKRIMFYRLLGTPTAP